MTASDEAKKALEGVTPGPWFTSPDGWRVTDKIVSFDEDGARHGETPNICIFAESEANASFIAWAREGVPALLAEIAAKDAEIARLTAQPSPDVAALVSMTHSLIAMVQHAIGPGRDVFIEPDTGRKLSDARAALARVKGGAA